MNIQKPVITTLLLLFSINNVPFCIEPVSLHAETKDHIRPGHPDWPMAWTTYSRINSYEQDFINLKSAGIGLIRFRADNIEQAKKGLDLARKTGMKFHISFPEITENQAMVKEAGYNPAGAVMIGGVYKGKAIDRHVYSFKPKKQSIIIEPPVYNQTYAYTTRVGKQKEQIAHYFPDIGAPFKAEIIVPLKFFDGKQHVRIIDAQITMAPVDSKVENDSTAGLEETAEIRTRKLWQLDFDLTGMNAMLDKVGISVYWQYEGSRKYWMFGRGNVCANAESTEKALRYHVRKGLKLWTEANGGTFPSDVILASRFGDECFYVSSHLNGPSVSYPIWGFSNDGIKAFQKNAGNIEHPRTWGFPEIYGPDAYGWWMYTLHESCAKLCGIVCDETRKLAPDLLNFRNQTRMGVFGLMNDHDGSGQELLTQNLDIVHLDPYPVGGGGYKSVITRDMSYCAGLARRYEKPLVPWMQAHTYAPGSLGHVSAEDVDRMAAEMIPHGVDAIIWLGWGRGNTFPLTRPESWQRAIAFHKQLIANKPKKPEVELAVLRPYTTWALSSRSDGKIRNPADWMLQQFLEVWAVKYKRAYDIFEIPPGIDSSQKLAAELKKYKYIVSLEAYPKAWVIGKNTITVELDPDTAQSLRNRFENQMIQRGMFKNSKR